MLMAPTEKKKATYFLIFPYYILADKNKIALSQGWIIKTTEILQNKVMMANKI